MRRIFVFLFLCAILITSACAPAAAVPAKPADDSIQAGQEGIPDVSLKNTLDLTGSWKFQKVTQWDEAMTKAGYADSSWGEVQSPAGWDQQNMADQVGQGGVVIYRKTVEVPANWKGLPIGISAWFNPFASRVFINGEQIEPARKPFAPYADISTLLQYGAKNTIAVATQYDGYLTFAEAGPARIGPVITRAVTKVLQDPVSLTTPSGKINAVMYHPEGKTGLPVLILAATGSHGLGELATWEDFARDLARQGYAALAIEMTNLSAGGPQAAVSYLRSQSVVDPKKIILFGVDAAAQAVVSTAGADPQVRGVILLSAAEADGVAKLAGRPMLLMAAKGDRNGFFVDQAQAMAQKAGGKSEVVTLPGNGHGTFLLQNTWNPIQSSLQKWLKSVNQ